MAIRKKKKCFKHFLYKSLTTGNKENFEIFLAVLK